jgi:uncharacterized protein involved in exopolysaccharide biosynthesis
MRPPTPGTSPLRRGEEDDESLVAFWNALRQCWKWATAAALLLAAGSAAAVLWFFEPVYQASAWIQIEDAAPYVAYGTVYQRPEQEEQFVKTQMELLRGPLVLAPALSRPEVARLKELRDVPNPTDWMKKRIQVEAVGHSALYTVSYLSPEPQSAAEVVNAIVEEYFEFRDQKEVARMQRVMTLLEEEKLRSNSRIHELREKGTGPEPASCGQGSLHRKSDQRVGLSQPSAGRLAGTSDERGGRGQASGSGGRRLDGRHPVRETSPCPMSWSNWR